MFAQMLVQNNLMNKSMMAGPVIFRERIREGEMESEVSVRFRKLHKIVVVEDFLP